MGDLDRLRELFPGVVFQGGHAEHGYQHLSLRFPGGLRVGTNAFIDEDGALQAVHCRTLRASISLHNAKLEDSSGRSLDSVDELGLWITESITEIHFRTMMAYKAMR